ncbi:MAG: A24 family peptidase [Alicyclobacillus sp.]|nr:A24 family peptidase [Alicyclobacillus sp.]
MGFGGHWPVVLWVYAFVLGSALGSFANVIGDRLPRGESVVWPRSHCSGCGRTLSAGELVPVAAWLFLRGRCRTCQTAIPVRYPTLELACGCWYAVTLSLAAPRAWAAWAVLWWLLAAACATDLTSMRVPNVLTLPGAGLTAILAAVGGMPWLTHVLAGAAVCWAVLVALHIMSRGQMGLGDAKLYLAIGAVLGPWRGLESLVWAAFCGTFIGLIWRARGRLQRRQPLPFVPFIAMGVTITALFGDAVWQWYVLHLLSGPGSAWRG